MFRKKAFIYNWWIGTKTEKLRFVDIFTEGAITPECIVVGQVKSPFRELEISRHPVIKIKKNGIITSSGRFYTFSTAHPLFLMYLKAMRNKERGAIAFNWRQKKALQNHLEADLVFPGGEYMANVTFDFTSDLQVPVTFSGYSEELQSKVVINTFDQKPWNPQYKGWISMIEVSDSAEHFKETRAELAKDVGKIFKTLNK